MSKRINQCPRSKILSGGGGGGGGGLKCEPDFFLRGGEGERRQATLGKVGF